MSVEASVSAQFATGAVFAGRYRVERRIAEGGMGAVYEVVHIETNRRRALKVMHAHYVSSDELRTRFRQEARVAADIDSEHIVDIFDAGIDEGTGMPFLVMELLRGEDLGRLSKRVGPLPKEDVVRYLYETSLALDKTHRARIVHRDLKPDNLFLCEREYGPPRVKVLDFGIAKIVKDSETKAKATRSLGTPLYMAPEQFQLTSVVSGATDIFALGMIAFTLLVGKPYWHAEAKMASEAWAFVMHVAMGPKEPPVKRAWELFGLELPTAFDAWFFQATARDPSSRFASASAAVLALADVLGVGSPASGFVVKDVPAAAPLRVADVAPAAPTPDVLPAPRTGPTMLAMTPLGKTSGLVQDKRRTLPWLLVGTGSVLVAGSSIVLIARTMSPPAASAPPAPALAQPSADTASIAPTVVTIGSNAPEAVKAPSEPLVVTIPSTSAAPVSPSRALVKPAKVPTTSAKPRGAVEATLTNPPPASTPPVLPTTTTTTTTTAKQPPGWKR